MVSTKEQRQKYQKKWRENNKEKLREYHKQWLEKNKEKQKEYQKKYKQKNKKYFQKYSKENRIIFIISQWKRIGLIVDDYESLYYLVQSTEKCESCGCILTDGISSTSRCMDHDHFTGQFRAVLCKSCNSTLPKQKQIKL